MSVSEFENTRVRIEELERELEQVRRERDDLQFALSELTMRLRKDGLSTHAELAARFY